MMLFKLNIFAIMVLCLNSVTAAPLPADRATRAAAAARASKEVIDPVAENNLADPAYLYFLWAEYGKQDSV
jgi:hypothetical protein